MLSREEKNCKKIANRVAELKKPRVRIPARNEQFNLREMQMSDEYQAPMIRSPSYGNEKKRCKLPL